MPCNRIPVVRNGKYAMPLFSTLKSFRIPYEMTWCGLTRRRYTFTCLVAFDVLTGICAR
jgi:hypothetical protein